MGLDFDDRPRLVFWEMTKACPLACVHCRAVAQPHRSPVELDTAEGKRLIDELGETIKPRPILVFTGGDCLMRDDLVELAAHAKQKGVPVAIAPSVSRLMNAQKLDELKMQGVAHASLSLDGACAATHEGVRQVAGHFAATIDAIGRLQAHGFQVQINTAVMAENVEELADIAALLRRCGVKIWEVFLLVNVGRGEGVDDISAEQAEDVCHFLVDAAQYGMVVRTVEAPFFRRVQKERSEPGSMPRGGALYQRLVQRLRDQLGDPTSKTLAPTSATRDGKGIIFVAHNGDVYPSGFLPLKLGNIRASGLMTVYRDHPLLRSIRASEFSGACGSCEFRDLCGGSRARAYAASGDPLGDDPACVRVVSAVAA